jgi:integrase
MKKLEQITDEQWNEVNEFNRFICDDFIVNSAELSSKTKGVYCSNLRIWFIWVKDFLNNKKQTDIKHLEFKKYQNWLINRGCSSADINNKRAAISSINNYIEIYYQDEYPVFHNFINKSIKRPPKAFVNEKAPLTKEEFSHLIDELTKMEEWQKIAYLKFTLSSACRRAESRQLMKNFIDTKPVCKKKNIVGSDGKQVEAAIVYYQTPNIRCKGRGALGKVRKLACDQEAMDALKKWIEVRGDDDCPYMFVTKYKKVVRQVSETTFDLWFKDCFEKIIGRRAYPHMIRSSRATQAVVEDGETMESVKGLLGHSDISITQNYVIRDETESVDELFIKK